MDNFTKSPVPKRSQAQSHWVVGFGAVSDILKLLQQQGETMAPHMQTAMPAPGSDDPHNQEQVAGMVENGRVNPRLGGFQESALLHDHTNDNTRNLNSLFASVVPDAQEHKPLGEHGGRRSRGGYRGRARHFERGGRQNNSNRQHADQENQKTPGPRNEGFRVAKHSGDPEVKVMLWSEEKQEAVMDDLAAQLESLGTADIGRKRRLQIKRQAETSKTPELTTHQIWGEAANALKQLPIQAQVYRGRKQKGKRKSPEEKRDAMLQTQQKAAERRGMTFEEYIRMTTQRRAERLERKFKSANAMRTEPTATVKTDNGKHVGAGLSGGRDSNDDAEAQLLRHMAMLGVDTKAESKAKPVINRPTIMSKAERKLRGMVRQHEQKLAKSSAARTRTERCAQARHTTAASFKTRKRRSRREKKAEYRLIQNHDTKIETFAPSGGSVDAQ